MSNDLTTAAENAAVEAGKVAPLHGRPPATTAIHPAQMIQAIIERPDVDLEKVERLFELQERYEANEAKKAYFDAVSRFQAEVPVIGHDQTVDYSTNKGGRTRFDFTSLPQIIKTVRPLLAKHGLTLTWRTGTTDQGHPIVTAVLTHELGYGEDTTLAAPIDVSGGKNPIQGLRSAWSYLRRLTGESILGIATGYDDDDDGASAGDRTHGPDDPHEQFVEPEPAPKPPMPVDAFQTAFSAAKPRLTSASQCQALINKLSTKYALSNAQISLINAAASIDDIPF